MKPTGQHLAARLALAGVLASCATVLAGPTLLITEVMTKARDWSWFVGFFSAAVVGGVIWRLRPTVIQHLVFGVAVAAAALTSLRPSSTVW